MVKIYVISTPSSILDTFSSGRALNAIPILNPNEPFRRIAGGQAQALLAGGDLQLNLSNADLLLEVAPIPDAVKLIL